MDAARDAFNSWSALDIGVPFAFVPDSTTAEVRVHWVDRFTLPISGHTQTDQDASNWITGATLDLAVHHRSGGVLDDNEMRAMALHEVGHALGLEHSQNRETVMAPTVRVRTLTATDRAAARRLYELRDNAQPSPRQHR
jgi:predicted Zn-dependent protease